MSIGGWIAAKTAGFTFKTAARGVLRSWVTWVSLAVLAAFLSLWAHDRYLHNLIHNKEDGYVVQLQNKQADVAVCEVQNVQLKAILVEQNAKIAEWKARGDELEHRAEIQEERIDELQEANDVILQKIDDEVIGETCEDAMRWMLAKALEMQNE